LQAKAVEGWDVFEGNSPHRPYIDAVKIRCESCGGLATRIEDVGNPWLDAGVVPFSTMGWNNPESVEAGYGTGAAAGVTVADLPSDIFKEHIWVSPFPEDDITHLVDAIGAERVLLGSDWPHLEGTPLPIDYLPQLGKLDADSVRRIMRDNGLELLT